MSIAYTMGKLLIGAPEMRSESAVRHFLDETVSVLNVRYVDLDYYSWTIARRFQETWESNEWEQLCIARSGLQFFTDLLRETVPAEELTATHFGDLDDFIRERGDDDSYLPEEEIPPEIPLSHWWWWYPKAPHRR